MKIILLVLVIGATLGCQVNSQVVKTTDASVKDAAQQDAGAPPVDASPKDQRVFDPTDDPNFVGCQEKQMEFLGGVITIAVGLWVGQCLIDWWRRTGK